MSPDGESCALPNPKAQWLSLAERGFRNADKLDYLIRRTVLDHSRQVGQSPSTRQMRSDGRLLSELQVAIGRYLQAEYDVGQPLPDRLLALVTQVERAA